MTTGPAGDTQGSLRQQLLDRARKENRPFEELLKYFAMERFLYRLSKSPHADKFVLKGALMFTVWKVAISRPTLDIDLLGKTSNTTEAIEDIVKDVCRQHVEPDEIKFDTESVRAQRIIEDANYEGVRVEFRATLGNSPTRMQIDIGFGDVVVPPPTMVDYPICFDLPAPRLRVYSRESTVAEKYQAMVKLGVLNSRMKDFFDLWFLSCQFDFDGAGLAKAMVTTFHNRHTEIPRLPVALTSEFAEDSSRRTQWQGFVRKNRLEDAPGQLDGTIAAIREFLGPVSEALSSGRDFAGIWIAPGPWQTTTRG